MFLSFFIFIIAAEAEVFRDFAQPLDVNDAFHRRTAGRNRHQIITFSDHCTGAATAAEATTSTAATPATAALTLSRRSLGGPKIDLARRLAGSAESALPTPARTRS